MLLKREEKKKKKKSSLPFLLSQVVEFQRRDEEGIQKLWRALPNFRRLCLPTKKIIKVRASPSGCRVLAAAVKAAE